MGFLPSDFDRQTGQERSRLGGAASSCQYYLNGGQWTLAAEYVEVEGGKRNDRPQLAAALALCQQFKAKLVVAKLDRLSRNLAFLAKLIESGVTFVAADMPHASKMTLQVLAVFTEHEREATSTRTKAALQAAKARGVKLGGPKLAEARRSGWASNKASADRFAANTKPIIEQIKASGVTSLRAIARALSARGVASARGCQWTPVQVSNVLRRAP
jgi:DNA invertase Pin-like site-specific DNA recombinase